MDDATLVKVVAARYLQDMGSEALRYLREMQELAAGLSDANSAEAWRDIADAARVILFTPTSGFGCGRERDPRSARFGGSRIRAQRRL